MPGLPRDAPLQRPLMGKTMTGSEQMFLTMTIAAFGFFAVVLAYVDLSTASVRDQNRR